MAYTPRGVLCRGLWIIGGVILDIVSLEGVKIIVEENYIHRFYPSWRCASSCAPPTLVTSSVVWANVCIWWLLYVI